MKKDLHKNYAALCSAASVPATSEYVFGALSKLTKNMSEANKLTKKVRLLTTLHAMEILARMAVAIIIQTKERKTIAGSTHVNGQEMFSCPKAVLRGRD